MTPLLCRPKHFGVVLMTLAAFSGIACGGKSANQNQDHASLRFLAIHYGMYVSAHDGMAPPNEQEFKSFIAEKFRVSPEAIEKVFISTRDHEPFVVLYDGGLLEFTPAGGPAIAHEKVGVNGKRLVALATTRVMEADEQRFLELVPK